MCQMQPRLNECSRPDDKHTEARPQLCTASLSQLLAEGSYHQVVVVGLTHLLHGREYVQEAYEDFKDCLLSEAASQLASAGSVGQLEELLQLHPYILLPSLLDVLAALPPTMPASSYTPMLQVGPGTSAASEALTLCLLSPLLTPAWDLADLSAAAQQCRSTAPMQQRLPWLLLSYVAAPGLGRAG